MGIKGLNKYWLLLVVVLSAQILFAQTKDDLEKKRKQKEQEIIYTKKILGETTKKQKETLSYLVTLNGQIQNREVLIRTIKMEIKYLDEEIEDNNGVISALQKDLEDLKEEYAAMVRFAYKNRNTYNKLGFILSAKTFNQSFKRLRLLQNYSEYRQKQMKMIGDTKEAIERKVTELQGQKTEKEVLLAMQNREIQNLLINKKDKNNLIKSLGKKEQQLKKELAEKQKIAKELAKKIKELIEAELAKKAKGFEMTPAVRKLSLDFANNRSKLPWPVEKGFVSEMYGRQKHPTLKNVYTVNNGIKIKTEKEASAVAIFKGTISEHGVIKIPGAGYSVIINHGEYYSVYSNLSQVFVKSGQEIDTGQPIGRIRYDNATGSTEMELQIWKQKDNMNPIYWLAPR